MNHLSNTNNLTLKKILNQTPCIRESEDYSRATLRLESQGTDILFKSKEE